MNLNPKVSVVIPAYESHDTLEKCLESLERQTFCDFEVIVIDSSPSDICERIVHDKFPGVRYEHIRERMLPHEARNYGVAQSTANLLIFTDPDIYPLEGWISQLLDDHLIFGDVIVGSVSCYGTKWLDRGIHIAKFDMWLPGGRSRSIEIAPTLNVLCPRTIYDEVGGFSGEYMIGDTIFSWDITAAGYQIHFSSKAEVVHHHISTWSGLLQERLTRGREYGRIRAERSGWSSCRILVHLVLTILPLRWMNLMMRTLQHSRSAKLLASSLLTFPIIMSAHAAWLWGECRGFLEALQPRKEIEP